MDHYCERTPAYGQTYVYHDSTSIFHRLDESECERAYPVKAASTNKTSLPCVNVLPDHSHPGQIEDISPSEKIFENAGR